MDLIQTVQYGKGLTKLRAVIEMVKTAVRESVAQSSAQKKEGDELPLHASILNIAFQSTKYIVSGQLDNKHQDKSAVRKLFVTMANFGDENP